MFAAAILFVLAATGMWNSFPRLWTWVSTSEPIAGGAAQWQQRTGGTPQGVGIAGTAVIVAYRTSVEAYGLGAGPEALAVQCGLGGGGGGGGRRGGGHRAAGPPFLPWLIGLPDDGRLRIIDPAAGAVLQTESPRADQRVAVAGGRVLTVTGTARDGTCYFSVVATAPPSGGRVWSRDGLNLRTAGDGSGCRPDRDPAGGYDVVLGVDPVGRDELIAAGDGRALWHGAEDEDVLAVDDGFALVRNADRSAVRCVAFAGGAAWRRSIGAGGSAALTPYAAIVANTKPGRITAVTPATGTVRADVRTDGKVFAVGPTGMILVSGREMAYIPFG